MTMPHGIEVEDLRILRAVATAGSFTAAAASLHYTQSGVSRRVAQLERTVGAPLFERLARGVRLTPSGQVVGQHAEELLRRLDVLADDLEALRAGTGGRLRVGSFQTANSSLTPAALDAFRAARPGVAVTVVEALTPALLDQLAGGALDVAVVSDYPTGALHAGAATLVHLLDDPLLVALPAGHRRAPARRLRLADLADESWIAAGPEGVDTVLALAAARTGFAPRVDIHVASWTAKLSYVAAGLGVTLVPGLLAAVVPPEVVLRQLHDELPARRVHAALPAAPIAAAEQFVDRLRAVAKGHRGTVTRSKP